MVGCKDGIGGVAVVGCCCKDEAIGDRSIKSSMSVWMFAAGADEEDGTLLVLLPPSSDSRANWPHAPSTSRA